MRTGHPRAEVVAHDDLRAAPEGLEGMDVGGHPVQQLLGAHRLGVEKARGAERGDEQLGIEELLAAPLVVDRDPASGEVDEELLAGLVLLAHDAVDVAAPAPVVLAELAVGVRIGKGLLVLEPEQHQRDVRPPELEVDLLPVRRRAHRRRCRSCREQQRLEAVVVEVLGQRPAKPGRLCAPEMVGDGRERHLQRRGALADAQALAETEA